MEAAKVFHSVEKLLFINFQYFPIACIDMDDLRMKTFIIETVSFPENHNPPNWNDLPFAD